MLTPDAGVAGGTIGLSIADAASRVERLGFALVNGSAPGRPGGANLVVALRSAPTLAHFDPELIQHWETAAGRGRPIELTRASHLPLLRPYAWGPIRIVDRLNEFNSFLSWGGTLRVEAVNPAETLAVFASPAPIVRWAGHSQVADSLAGEVGAFFAEIKVPIDFEPGAESAIAAASPVTLYAMMLRRLVRRMDAAHLPWVAEVDGEARRIRETAPGDWEAAGAIAHDLGLDRG
ncbi:MAG: hypothetical protein H6Q36_369 [Chloroflexi bacterium]|nr:hypothetical protein [Chloroflexota bacterium]